jgi:hypothetical protein
MYHFIIVISQYNLHIPLDTLFVYKMVFIFDRFIKKQTVNGSTGNVAFDDNGDRINAEYDIINVQNQTQISVGQYHYSNVRINSKLMNFMYRQIVYKYHL